tara:strand:- start:1084 stop:1374 length:291 start_codon:yes stop_codon:yes gene_type:complete
MEYAIAIVVLFVIVYAYLNRDESGTTTSSTPAPVSKPRVVKSKVVADKNNNGVTSKAELKTLTKVQLLELADKQSLKVKRSGSKAAVINEIHSQLK